MTRGREAWRGWAAAGLIAGLAVSGGAAAAPCTLAVEHVAVAPMDGPRVLHDYTVRFHGARIGAVGPSSQVTGRGCRRRIDGDGQYLAPGLIDSHVHLETVAFADAFGLARPRIDLDEVLLPYLAAGVTGVRVLSGAPDILAFRDARRRRHRPTPHLVVASPMLAGDPPVLPEPFTRVLRTPEEARRAVRDYARDGYDLIKIRENLGPEVTRAVLDEAAAAGLDVDGHFPTFARADPAAYLATGQRGIAHLDELVRATEGAGIGGAATAALLKARGGYVTSALSVEQSAIDQMSDPEALFARPQMRWLHPLMVQAFWLPPNNPYQKGRTRKADFERLLEQAGALARSLAAADAALLAGSDAMNPMILPGAGLHDELGLLVQAGLTPYQALRAATARPAAVIPGFAAMGQIAPGRASSAVLVDKNPTLDLGALRRPRAVIVDGVWYGRDELDRRLAALARSRGARQGATARRPTGY